MFLFGTVVWTKEHFKDLGSGILFCDGRFSLFSDNMIDFLIKGTIYRMITDESLYLLWYYFWVQPNVSFLTRHDL